jgi:hypothetical protein
VLCGAALCLPAGAVITRLYPLGDVISGADTIVVAQVKSSDRKKHRAALKTTRTLKGKAAWTELPVQVSGGDDRSQAALLEARLTPGRSVVLFNKGGKFTLGYVEGTWFRLAEPPKQGSPWPFVHLELYLRRTFKGTSAEMQQAVSDVLGGKPAPPPDPSAKPGYGSA